MARKKTLGEQLRKLGRQRALISFHDPSSDPLGSMVRGVGLVLGDALDDRVHVLHAAAEALEDMNFHNDAATLREMAGDGPQMRRPDHVVMT